MIEELNSQTISNYVWDELKKDLAKLPTNNDELFEAVKTSVPKEWVMVLAELPDFIIDNALLKIKERIAAYNAARDSWRADPSDEDTVKCMAALVADPIP